MRAATTSPRRTGLRINSRGPRSAGSATTSSAALLPACDGDHIELCRSRLCDQMRFCARDIDAPRRDPAWGAPCRRRRASGARAADPEPQAPDRPRIASTKVAADAGACFAGRDGTRSRSSRRSRRASSFSPVPGRQPVGERFEQACEAAAARRRRLPPATARIALSRYAEHRRSSTRCACSSSAATSDLSPRRAVRDS